MTEINYINQMKRDFGFGRCEDVPQEMVEMLLYGEENTEDDNELPFL